MSCSKPVATTAFKTTLPTRMHKPSRDSVKKMLSPSGYPYIQEKIAVLIEKGEEKDLYVILNFKALNKKAEMKTTMLSIWRINCNVDEDMPRLRTTEFDKTVRIEGTTLNFIHCPCIIDWMLDQEDKTQIGMPFTSNDPAMMSSFRPGSRNGRCNEHLVMCLGKTLFSEACCAKNPLIPYDVAMTSPRCSPDMLNAVLERKDNATRFAEEPGQCVLTDEERKALKKRRLAQVRVKIEALGAERFGELYLTWLRLNKTMDRSTDPVVFKDKIGGNILMNKEMVDTWGKLAPLLFIWASSKTWLENPANCAVAVTCDRQTCIAEVTPKDERYGVKPPNGYDLTWCAETAEGVLWILETMKSHGKEQEAFIAKMEDLFNRTTRSRVSNPELHAELTTEGFEMLTDGLNQYKFGILGLTKAILLAIGRAELVIPTQVHRKIQSFLAENGLGHWWLNAPILDTDADEQNPFELMMSVGSEAEAAAA